MNTKITLVELVDLMAESTSTSKRVCEIFLREFFNTVAQTLVNGENVKIKGIGTFKVATAKSRKSADPNREDSAQDKLTFIPDKSLAEALNQPFAQFEAVMLDDALTEEKLDEIDKLYPSYFPETGDLPEPPDYLIPPAPDADDIPEITQTTHTHPQEQEIKKEDIKPVQPAKAKAIPDAATRQIDKPVKEPSQPAKEPVKPLMGIPIDGPTEPAEEPAKPVINSEPKEEENDRFYRPAPRNAYTPTQEQLSQQERLQHRGKYMKWVWSSLGIVAAGGLIWMLSSLWGGHASGTTDANNAAGDTVPMAEIYEPENDVVTDTVTAQIVLVTLAEKHYGSPWFWVYIYEENKDKITNPNNVKPGTVVVIPPAEKYGIDVHDKASLKKAQRRSWELLK